MNAYFRKALTISRVYLVDNIDYENLKDFLLEYGILSESILETIDSLPNRRQKVREMLDCLPRRADVVFPTFLVSLCRSNQQHISMKLYESTIDLIASNDFQLKESLENDFKKLSSSLRDNNRVTANTKKSILFLEKQHKEPTENSLPPDSFHQRQAPKTAMEVEDFDTFESEPLSNDLTFSSFKYSGKFDSFSLKSQQTGSSIASSSSSSLHQFHDNSLVYQMDSFPRGLFCIIKERSPLTSDAFPVQCKEGDSISTGNDTYKPSIELQTLFWDFGFHSCVVELDNSTLHPDKLTNIVFDFSRVLFHKVDCCAIALLGFSATDLHLVKIFSSFNEKHCPSLARKPKLFLIEVPNSGISPNLMSGIEIPEDTLVAIGEDETNTQPGLVSSVVQVCRQMEKSSYSMQEIFSKVQHNNSKLKIAVEKSLTKQWIVNSQSKFAQQEPIST